MQGLQQIGGALAGAAPGDASTSQRAGLDQKGGKQATMLSYIDVFHTLMIFVFCIAPLAIFLRPTTGQQGGH